MSESQASLPPSPCADEKPNTQKGYGVTRIFLPMLLAVPVLLFIAAMSTFPSKQKETEASLPVLGEVPEFGLFERSGKSVTRESLKGRIWIADFIFTRCGGPCPLMTRHFALVQDEIKRKAQKVCLVTFTLDPEYDSQEILASYAKAYNAEPELWLFVRGEKAAIQRLAMEGFKLSAIEQIEGQIIHSTHFVLVDARSRIRGYYDGQDAEALKKLGLDLDRLTSVESEESL